MSALDTFFSAWAETDADKRTALIAQSCTDDVNYADPRSKGPVNGIAAVSEYVGMFSANAPGWDARVMEGKMPSAPPIAPLSPLVALAQTGRICPNTAPILRTPMMGAN